MDFGGLAPVNSGMPIRVWVAVDGHSKIASADPLLHDLFKLGRCLFLLIHAASFLLIALAARGDPATASTSLRTACLGPTMDGQRRISSNRFSRHLHYYVWDEPIIETSLARPGIWRLGGRVPVRS
jgi:hypothetical protein